MDMRKLINLLEERDPHFGEGLWVSPKGETCPCDDEHPDFLREFGYMMGLEPWQTHSDDANFHAIQKGWTRVVIYRNGTDTNLAAATVDIAKKAFKALVRGKWSSASRDSQVFLDIYGDDPDTPDISKHAASDFLRS